MKTSYEILWIDDEPDSLEDYEFEIKEFLDENGIELNTEIVPKVDESLEEIKNHIIKPELDIIMVDYRMGEQTGSKIIEKVRENNQYLPVIFYSAADIPELFNEVSKLRLDGVYITSRNFLVEKTKNVIKSLIKKEETIKRTRGLLLEGVSEIDAQLSEIILDSWDQIKQCDQKQIFNQFQNGNVKFKQTPAANISLTFEKFAKNVKTKIRTTSFKLHQRCDLALLLLKTRNVDINLIDILNKFNSINGQGETLKDLRNKYAHETREELAKCHNQKRCISIRRMLREQFGNIEKIRNLN